MSLMWIAFTRSMWRRNHGSGSIPPHTMCPTSGPSPTSDGSVPAMTRSNSSPVSQNIPAWLCSASHTPVSRQAWPIRLSVWQVVSYWASVSPSGRWPDG